MATHPAQASIDHAVTTLTGLTSTGTNVFRRRAYDIPEANLPALHITLGGEEILGEQGRLNYGFIDAHLTINIEIKVKQNTDADTTILGIREEVYQAFKSAYSGRDSSIIHYWEERANEPQNNGADLTKTSYELVYIFKYRRAV